MTEYTPTTDEVREAVAEWVWSRRMFRPELEASDGAEADRWLEANNREVAAKAWDEGAAWAAVECGALTSETQGFLAEGDNPYRGTPEQEGKSGNG